MEVKSYDNIDELLEDMKREEDEMEYILGIPQHTYQAFYDYVNKGAYPGGFVRACLQNDFYGAVRNADRFNRKKLVEILEFMVQHIPAYCWGSPEAFDAHMQSFKEKNND